jgi:hypothetical protein
LTEAGATEIADALDDICQATVPEMSGKASPLVTAPYMINPGSGKASQGIVKEAKMATRNGHAHISLIINTFLSSFLSFLRPR